MQRDKGRGIIKNKNMSEKNTKFCQNCGKEVEKNAEICVGCGVRVGGEKASPGKEKKPFWKKWWVWVIVVFLIIIIASTGDDTTKREVTTTPEEGIDLEWAEVGSFEGSGSRNTASFELMGNETRIHWEFEDTSGIGAGMFSFYLVPSGTDIMDTGGFPEVMIQGSDSDTNYVHNKSGQFYVEVNSANGPWSIIVEDLQ